MAHQRLAEAVDLIRRWSDEARVDHRGGQERAGVDAYRCGDQGGGGAHRVEAGSSLSALPPRKPRSSVTDASFTGGGGGGGGGGSGLGKDTRGRRLEGAGSRGARAAMGEDLASLLSSASSVAGGELPSQAAGGLYAAKVCVMGMAEWV
nr:unnamed protein product [Digitaria exilis]